MSRLYPLCFKPLFRRYLWGGRRLATVLNKPVGAGDDYAESWEIVDHGQDQSIVQNGDLAGTTLGELVAKHGRELFGRHAPQSQFPLLFKFLDCNRDLSVQVHPNDNQGAKLDPTDLGKTEAWVILHADPGSLVYAGLREGIDRETLARRIAAGQTADSLHRFEAKAGDCIFIPAGTVHALGAGLVVAEIKQASDTTFRLYDWDRVGADGNPRPLHVQQALEVIDYTAGPVEPRRSLPGARVENLVECDKFVLNRCQFDNPIMCGGDERFHIIAVLSGTVTIDDANCPSPLGRGQLFLIPADAPSLQITPNGVATVLDMFLP